MSKGEKPKALETLRKKKAAEAQYNAHMAKHPELSLPAAVAPVQRIQPAAVVDEDGFDQSTFDAIIERKEKFTNAVQYNLKILGNKAHAIKLLDKAEECKKLAANYQASGKKRL